MTFEFAVRLTEMLVAWAILLQSLEHFSASRSERWLFVPRFATALLLLVGVMPSVSSLVLLVFNLAILYRFDGPYNGGSDRLGTLILISVSLAHLMPTQYLAQLAFGYLAIQLVLSYAISGWVKVVNPEWRRGQALVDVFLFSAYPACQEFRSLAERRFLLWLASWTVMLFELAFPLALLSREGLILALAVAAAFHMANAVLFGLNRFFWTWISAYPSLIWLQSLWLEG